jgi:hypothetical protein
MTCWSASRWSAGRWPACSTTGSRYLRVTTDGSPNACSLLYAAAWQAAKALGYRRLITYTQKGVLSPVRAVDVRSARLSAGRSVTCRIGPRSGLRPNEDRQREAVLARPPRRTPLAVGVLESHGEPLIVQDYTRSAGR